MLKYFLFVITVLVVISCDDKKSESKMSPSEESFNNPEEELNSILRNEGWVRISNCTNVYRRDIADIVNDQRVYKATYWYTASIYSKNINGDSKYIIARPVYYSREDNIVNRNEDGSLVYKTFPIVQCDFTDKYGSHFNGYINDGGSTAYIVY